MSEIKSSLLTDFYEYDVDVPSRTLFLGPETETHQSERAIKGLHLLCKTKGDITILTQNTGGDEYSGFAIYDAIKSLKNITTMVCFGNCMSMGVFILQAATRRVLAPNCRVMMHYGTWAFEEGHVKDFERQGEEVKFLNKRMEDVLFQKMHKKNKSFTMEDLRAMLRFDTYLSSTEAVKLGLADEVLK